MGLLKTILIILAFYYGFKFLARLFAPVLIKKAAETMQKKAEEQFRTKQQKEVVREGETVIDKKPTKNQQSKDSVGEYVDFEEIE
ncbi:MULTISPECIES: DUF4834 family protein [Polaribacter]|uniref:DUF4834 family protein n=2 Tax=Polaribacter TaxID=52959 RepID=A0A975H6T3_9FLAO|nr:MULTISPECIES: DUF4834 family protein [Polaribacter]QTD37202.1 DUF4834 family protein [Polaribacter batillariae]QTE22333.1 DUF4834 family protein [Polaribacter cellanae]